MNRTMLNNTQDLSPASLLGHRVLIILILLVALSWTACGGGEPQERVIPVEIGAEQMSPETVRVSQGDTVTLKINSHQTGEFHLHGYDLEQEVEADQVAEMLFVAAVTGRFRITFHRESEDHEKHGKHGMANGHGDILASEPIQQGDTFSFKIMESMEPQIIRYHSHLHPEVAGSIMVSHDGPDAGTVKIDIRAMALHPSEVTVRPGTEVIWTNQGAEIQALASGVHPEAKSTSEEKHGEDEERDIGFLEVLPR